VQTEDTTPVPSLDISARFPAGHEPLSSLAKSVFWIPFGSVDGAGFAFSGQPVA